MPLREDCRGLESLPLKLMIVAVVASLSVVPAAGALQTFRNRDFVMRAELQLDTIISAAQTLMIDGPGGVRTISLDFSNGGSVKFEQLVIGDREGGPNMSSVLLGMSTGSKMVRTASEPPVWLKGPNDEGVTVLSSSFELRMSTLLEGRHAFVLVEVI